MSAGEFVGVVDYGVGTWTSVVNMIDSLGINVESCQNPDELGKFSHIILPGVGNFSVAASQLDLMGWRHSLLEKVSAGLPTLGICLGMQLLGEASEESSGKGLGVMPFESQKLSENGALRVPHMGWNSVEIQTEHEIFSGWTPESRFYFVHSFAVPLSGASTIGVTKHNEIFSSVVARENVVGVQFHPEKSHRFGKKLFENFVRMG